jgi:probable phosphoglycerate mutase
MQSSGANHKDPSQQETEGAGDQRSKRRRSKATTLLLVRHGKTPTTGKVLPGRKAGLHLSEEGVEMARAIAEKIFESFPSPDAIYSSPMERALETAAPYSTLTKLPIIEHPGILECDFGEWTAAELKSLYRLKEWKIVQSRPSLFRFPNGESFSEMSERMRSFMLEVAEKHRGGVVVAYSHADPIKALISDCLGMHLDQFQRILISVTSVSNISVLDGLAFVQGINYTPAITKGAF